VKKCKKTSLLEPFYEQFTSEYIQNVQLVLENIS